MARVDNIKRVVAAQVAYACFHHLDNAGAQISNLMLRRFAPGLTKKELLLLQQVVDDTHKLASVVRALAWRLEGNPGAERGMDEHIRPYLRSKRA